MTVMTQVLVLFLLIVVGFSSRRLNIVSKQMDTDFGNLITKVTLPAFVLSSMDYDFSYDALLESMNLLKVSACIYAVVILASFIIVKWMPISRDKVDIYQFAISFTNVGFMGYPVISLVYGSQGVFYAAIYNLSYNILIWTYGIYLLKRHQEDARVSTIGEKVKDIFNPGLVAIILGFILFLTPLSFPEPIQRTLSLIGSTTTPLSMMFIGLLLAEIHLKELINSLQDYFIIAIRLLIIPFVVLIVLSRMGFEGYMLGIPVLISAMPIAANSAVFASIYGGNSKLASKLVFLSTLISVITIPFFMIKLGS